MDLYTTNPFRVLGLKSNASGKEAAKAADRLLKWIELGEFPPVEDALPFLEPLRFGRDEIKKALAEIEGPRTRIKVELFWPDCEFSGYETSQEFLKEGRFSDLLSVCETAISNGLAGHRNSKTTEPRLDAALGFHFLAVFFHSSCLVSGDNRIPPLSARPRADWNSTFKYWGFVLQDEVFWRHVEGRARGLNDPRITQSYLEQLRKELPHTLLGPNVADALASVESLSFDHLIRSCKIISQFKLGQESQTALGQIASAIQSRFEAEAGPIRSSTSESTIRLHVPKAVNQPDPSDVTLDSESLTAYLAGVEQSIVSRLVPVAVSVQESNLDQTECGQEILDGVAYAYRSVSLAFNNCAGMPHASLRLTAEANKFARSSQCKRRLQEDYQSLVYLSLQKDAIELAQASRYRESLTKLQEAKRFTSSDEERRTIDEWMDLASKRRVLEGLKPVEHPPTMYTFNGIGTRLYGKSGYDANSGSFISTLYFTFIFLPLFPFASYRVTSTDGRSYRFLGKVPLKPRAFLAPAIVVAAAIIFFIFMSTSSTSSPSSTGSFVGTSVPSDSPTADKNSLWLWIEQERKRLDSEQTELDSDGAQIDAEKLSLDGEAKALNSGTPSQSDIDAYEAERQEFNSKVEAYNARLAQYQADTTTFNAQVNRYNSMP